MTGQGIDQAPSPSLTQPQRVYLDLLRGMAALLVVVGHATIFFWVDSPLFRANIQTLGVYVFFLLSGFLISYSAFAKHGDRNYGFRHYFIDRFARIYTGLVPALVFVWLVDMQTMQVPPTIPSGREQDLYHLVQMNQSLPTWLGNLFMLQNFPLFQILRKLAGIAENPWFFQIFGSARPFWTISIEWWIYMLFGMVAVWRVKTGRPFKWWHWPLLAFAAVGPLYYAVGGYDSCLTLLWLFGMGASLLFLNWPRLNANSLLPADPVRQAKGWLAVSLIGATCVIGRLAALKLNTGRMEFTEFQFTFFAGVTLFALLFAMRDLPPLPRWIARPAAFLADFSFSLYLTHFSIMSYLYARYPGHDNDTRMVGVATAISLAVAIIFWFLFERHYRRIGRLLKARYAA